MFYGIAAGATWAVETIILGIALSMAPFVSTEQAIFLAPFVSTFIHDAFSALWATLYNGVRGNLKMSIKPHSRPRAASSSCSPPSSADRSA